MARVAAIVLAVLAAVGVVAGDLEMRLRAQHNRLNLKVTVYEGEHFEWRKVCCRWSNDAAKLTLINSTSSCSVKVKDHSTKSAQRRKTAPANFNLQLIIERNGFAECRYDNFSSNVEFYRMENEHVYVVRIKEHHSNSSAQKLQELVRNEFRVAQVAPTPNVFHLTSKSYDSMTADNDVRIWKSLKQLVQNASGAGLEVTAVLSTKYCMPLELYSGNVSATPTNRLIVPRVDFVQENLTPFALRCVGGFFSGVDWDADDLRKYNNLPRIVNYNTSNDSAALNTPYKIQAFSDSLTQLNVTQLSLICARFDALVDSKLLVGMKGALNTSNELLEHLDKVLVSGDSTSAEVVKPRFAAKVQNVSAARGAGGFAIFQNDDAQFDGGHFNSFNINQTDGIITEAPTAAVFLPQALLNAEGEQEKVAVAVFKEGGALFDSTITTSSVISVTIGAKTFDELVEPVKIWFRRDVRKQPEAGTCMSWDFNANQGNGGWSAYGCRLVGSHACRVDNWTVVDECACWHMTHFGEIFWDSDRPFFTEGDTENEGLLNFITFSGCILSLIGLSGVFLTAIISPSWLAGPGQKIQLQMSVNLALLLVLFMFLTSDVKIPKPVCSFLGGILHYVLLSNFSWMLLAAYLQYSRLVKVVTRRSSRLLLKSGAIGWGLPLIPVVLTFITGNFKVYSGEPLCLPSGVGFYATIFAPLVAIMACNVIVFVLIARSLFQTIEIRRHDVSCLNTTRYKQLVFLFMLLGLSWVFAVLQVVVPAARLFFAYLFCIAIGSQGVVYFVFFVVMDAKALDAWSKPFRNSSAIKYDVNRLTRRAGLIYSTRSSSYSSTSSNSRTVLDIAPRK